MLSGGLSLVQISLLELLRQRQTVVLEARNALELAMVETRLTLGARLAPLAADPALARNLDWQLTNSVKGALEARVSPGQVDHILILDEACRELFRAGKGPSIACQDAKNAATNGLGNTLATSASGGPPRLGLALRLGSSLLLGDVALNEIWLTRHQQLKTSLERSGVTLERSDINLSPSAIVVAQSGGTRLVTRQPLDRFFRLDRKTQSFVGGAPQFSNPFLWPTLAATAAFAILALAHSARRRLRLVTAIRDHADAILNSAPTAQSDINQRSPDHALAAVRQQWSALHESIQNERRDTRQKQAQYEAKIKALEGDVIELEEKLTAQAGFESLATQLSAATRPFLERLARLRDVAENLQDVTTYGVAQVTDALATRLTNWRRGLEERGARKFIRSLAESPSALRSDQTLLDDELQAFAALGDQLRDLALHARLGTQAALAETAEVGKLAAHWEALASGAASVERCVTLVSALAEATTLAKASGLAIMPIDLSEVQCVWPTLPARAAVSALYHLLATLAAWQTPGTPIVARIRREAGRTMVVFSVHSVHQAAASSDKQTKHLETAKALLLPHGITLAVLPTRAGASPIVLRWDDTRDIDTRNNPGFELSGSPQRC